MRNLFVTFFLLAACSGESVYKSALGWELWRAGMKEKKLTVQGFEIAYLESRPTDPQKPETIVLVHGFGANKETWMRFASHLPERMRVIALDVPGFGESTRDMAQNYDIPTQASRLHYFIQALGVKKAHLAGNSMGGSIVAYYALSYPEEVATLFLIDAAGVITTAGTDLRKALSAGNNPLVISTEAEYDGLLALSFVVPPSIPSSVKRYFVAQSAANRALTEKIYADMNNSPIDLTSRLSEIHTRTLVLWGDSDRLIDKSVGEVYAAGIEGAKMVVMDKCGHAPQLERPKEAAEIYALFLDGK